jgi:hypothetical protein
VTQASVRGAYLDLDVVQCDELSGVDVRLLEHVVYS